MPVRLVAHRPDAVALLCVLFEEQSYTLGRDPDCDLVLDHGSVSRRHAHLAFVDGGWRVTDLASKNGVRIDGNRIDAIALRSGQWFVVGDVYCQFVAIDAVEIAAQESRADQHRQVARVWCERIQHADSATGVMADLLKAVLELAECRRGFLLFTNAEGEQRLLACYRLGLEQLCSRRFSYSSGAIERALQERRPVFMSNAQDAAWLRQRSSVFAQHLRVVVCLPFIHEGRLLGAVYADNDQDDALLSSLDGEILTALAKNAAPFLVSPHLLDGLSHDAGWIAVDDAGYRLGQGAAPTWAELLASNR